MNKVAADILFIKSIFKLILRKILFKAEFKIIGKIARLAIERCVKLEGKLCLDMIDISLYLMRILTNYLRKLLIRQIFNNTLIISINILLTFTHIILKIICL